MWGKVVERAGALKGSFDAASLTSLLWALTTSGVEHYRTVAELAGTAAALLPKLSPVQVGTRAGQGRAGRDGTAAKGSCHACMHACATHLRLAVSMRSCHCYSLEF